MVAVVEGLAYGGIILPQFIVAEEITERLIAALVCHSSFWQKVTIFETRGCFPR